MHSIINKIKQTLVLKPLDLRVDQFNNRPKIQNLDTWLYSAYQIYLIFNLNLYFQINIFLA